VRNRLLVAAAAFAAIAVAALVFHHRLGQFVRGPSDAPITKLPSDPNWVGDAYLTITGASIADTDFVRVSTTRDRDSNEIKHQTIEGYYLLETQPKAYMLVRSSEPPTIPVTGILHGITDFPTDGKVLHELSEGLPADTQLSAFILDANDPFRPLRFGFAIAGAVFLFGTWHLVLGLTRARTRGAFATLAMIPGSRDGAVEELSPGRVWVTDELAIASSRFRLDVIVFRDVVRAQVRATERETSVGTEVTIEVEIATRDGRTLAVEVGHEYHAQALLQRIHVHQPTALAG
jgi:hypothetical protein